MSGGTMLGNIYGGGRLGNVGMDEHGAMYTSDLENHGALFLPYTENPQFLSAHLPVHLLMLEQ